MFDFFPDAESARHEVTVATTWSSLIGLFERTCLKAEELLHLVDGQSPQSRVFLSVVPVSPAPLHQPPGHTIEVCFRLSDGSGPKAFHSPITQGLAMPYGFPEKAGDSRSVMQARGLQAELSRLTMEMDRCFKNALDLNGFHTGLIKGHMTSRTHLWIERFIIDGLPFSCGKFSDDALGEISGAAFRVREALRHGGYQPGPAPVETHIFERSLTRMARSSLDMDPAQYRRHVTNPRATARTRAEAILKISALDSVIREEDRAHIHSGVGPLREPGQNAAPAPHDRVTPLRLPASGST